MATIVKTYKPVMMSGQVYMRKYGSSEALEEVGNVLKLEVKQEEDTFKQPDMRKAGGGTYAQVRRIKEIGIDMELADLNRDNLRRALFGSTTATSAGSATNEEHDAVLGSLLTLKHINPTSVTVKKGADSGSATEVTAAKNFDIRPEGIYILPDAEDITGSDTLWISYSYGDYDTIQAITTSAPELEIVFGGLNEAADGLPLKFTFYKVSLGVAETLSLLTGNEFATLAVSGEVLVDPTKTGVGISRFYKVEMA